MNDRKKSFLERLVQENNSALLRFLTRKVNNREEAAEIAQEAYLRLYQLEAPEELDSARAFLYQTAANMAIDQLRRKTVHQKFLRGERDADSGEFADERHSDQESPQRIAEAQERVRIIYQAIDELPFKCKQAFLMHRNKGMTYSEIAELLGISVSSVEKYILQALRQCRDRLNESDAEKKQNNY